MARISTSIVRLGGAIAVGATLLAFAGFVDGCGSIPCSETDTCQADDAQPSVDQSVQDFDAEAGAPNDGPSDARVDSTVGDADADSASEADADAEANVDADASDGEGAIGDAQADAADADASDGCVKHTENCTNGIDDDCNGLIDCADPACNPAYQCVPSWPSSGWTAPVVLYDDTVAGGPAPAPASCVAPYAADVMDGHDTPVAADAGCSCSCGSVQGASCSNPSAVVYVSGGCGGGQSYGAALPNGVCTTIENQQGGLNSGQVVDAGVLTNGSCLSTSTPSVPAWNPATNAAWAGTGRTCAPQTARTFFSGAQGGCDAGFTCTESPPGTFPHVCLLAAGHIPTCPMAYSDTHRYFDGGTDTRACQFDCSCGTPTGLQCTPTVDVYSGSGCSGAAIPISTCTAFSNLGTNNTVSGKATFNTLTGQCAVDAGATQAIGSVQATSGEMTVCCVPP
jgi:hypothetical protein